jgi:anti-anti-sigma factor
LTPFPRPPNIPYKKVTAQASILVGCNNKVVWIKVEGKGSFQNSQGMKDFAREMMNRGFREFFLDLKNCSVMDSTFMGTLAGMGLRLRELGQGNLHVINSNDRNTDLLQNLGLDHLFDLDATDETHSYLPNGGEALTSNAFSKSNTAETMLEAHEALVEAAPENEARFKDVLEYLKNDLHVSGATDS